MNLVQAIIDHDSQEDQEMSSTEVKNEDAPVLEEDEPVAQDPQGNTVEESSPTIDTTPDSSNAEVGDEETDNASEETEDTEEAEGGKKGEENAEEGNEGEDEIEDGEDGGDEEAKAIAEATASADASYTPPVSLLNSASPYPLIRSVDGMSLKKYNATPAVYTAKKLPVPLRGKINVPIPISIGGSVVQYYVESEDFDIGFGVAVEREDGITEVSPHKRVDSHVKAVSGKFLVGSVPCALVFTFDNEYSWFREKRITYQITVKPPTKENIVSGRKLRAKTALKIVTQDKISAEERFENVSDKRQELVQEVERLEKELEEKKKSLGVVEKEESWLRKRVQLRSVQEDLLNRRLADGWEDEDKNLGDERPTERAEI